MVGASGLGKADLSAKLSMSERVRVLRVATGDVTRLPGVRLPLVTLLV